MAHTFRPMGEDEKPSISLVKIDSVRYNRHKAKTEYAALPEFNEWFDTIRDKEVKFRILQRIRRLSGGNTGDSRRIGSGISEYRVHFGPGHRIYYLRWEGSFLLLLVGGDKSTQKADITKAKKLANAWKQNQQEENNGQK